MCRSPRISGWSPLAAAAFILLAGTSSPAADNLTKELAAAAAQVKQTVAKYNENSVVVGEFPSSGYLEANGGPLIATTLAEQLEKHGVKVERRARFEVKGSYYAGKDPSTELPAISIRFEIVDLQQAGERVAEFKRALFGFNYVAVLTGVTAEFEYEEGKKPPYSELGDTLEDRIDNPQTFVSMGTVSASFDSPFGLEVLVKSGEGYEKRPATNVNGEAIVKLGKDEIYAIRIVNNAEFEAAVKLTVDGLSMFHFTDEGSDLRDREGRPLSTHVILNPKSYGDVQGWFRNYEKTSLFQIKKYSENAPPHLRNKADIGTITASFSAVWKKNEPKPPGEPLNPDDLVTAREYTELGADIHKEFKRIERDFGVVRAVVTIRYSEKSD